jgi:hypothetical protein
LNNRASHSTAAKCNGSTHTHSRQAPPLLPTPTFSARSRSGRARWHGFMTEDQRCELSLGRLPHPPEAATPAGPVTWPLLVQSGRDVDAHAAVERGCSRTKAVTEPCPDHMPARARMRVSTGAWRRTCSSPRARQPTSAPAELARAPRMPRIGGLRTDRGRVSRQIESGSVRVVSGRVLCTTSSDVVYVSLRDRNHDEAGVRPRRR